MLKNILDKKMHKNGGVEDAQEYFWSTSQGAKTKYHSWYQIFFSYLLEKFQDFNIYIRIPEVLFRFIYVVQDLVVCGFLIFMKKFFRSWTTALFFLSFLLHNFDTHKKAGTVRVLYDILEYGVSCVDYWLWCTICATVLCLGSTPMTLYYVLRDLVFSTTNRRIVGDSMYSGVVIYSLAPIPVHAVYFYKELNLF